MASSSKRSFWPATIIAITLFALVIALPDSWKTWAPKMLKPSAQLGLDLAGGTQLDFRISEDELIERKATLKSEIAALSGGDDLIRKQNELASLETQHSNIVEAIRGVLERRINSLGVSEATITPSYFGDEKHLLVECPGIVDKEKCIATVGKTIQLEFKEALTGDEVGYEETMRSRANDAFKAATAAGGALQKVGQDLGDQLGITYFDSRPVYASSLPKGLEGVLKQKPADGVRKTEGAIQSISQNADGQSEVVSMKGIYLTEVLEPLKPTTRPVADPREAYEALTISVVGAKAIKQEMVDIATLPSDLQSPVQTMTIGTQQEVTRADGSTGLLYLAGRTDGGQQMQASHILVQYAGALRADPSVTRTKEEAAAKIKDLKSKLNAGTPFQTVASTDSDGPSKAKAGSLGLIARGVMGDSFDTVAFALPTGGVSDVVETPFGFHIIRADTAAAVVGSKASYALLSLPEGTDAAALKTKVENGEVTREDSEVIVRTMFFSLVPTGWKDTALNGRRFRSASVTTDPTTGIPVVQIIFDEEGGKIFYELTKKNIGKQIAIFVGGELVSAPTVQSEISGGTAVITGSRTFEEARLLAQDLNTGAIPAPIHLVGQTTVEATLGTDALHQSIIAAAWGMLALCIFMILIYRVLGVIASIALFIYVVLLVAVLKLPLFLVTDQKIVLTLAGIAGLILSIGMAVDANVLIFERMKEELMKGKLMKTAVETGFKRAWPSIRDGNFSTLITCSILFMIGTSIIKGFSVVLSVGIVLSMFTAVVISRWMCRKLASSPLGKAMEKPTDASPR